MIELVRKIVAGPKNRTNWKGTNLDLTYITQRIIAMAYPASGFQKTYRNSIDDIAQYFKEKHQGKCLVINVSMRQYNYQLFNNLVKEYFWPDHQAPPLTTIFVICEDILKYLRQSGNGVVAVHCNHGKGRTGTCIIAYMLFTNQFDSAEKALRYYNKRRFIVDTYGVDQPCQRRYLDYVQQILKTNKIQQKLKAYKLVKINHKGLDQTNYFVQISLTRTCQTKHTKLNLHQILKNNSIPLIADIFIQLYQYTWVSEKQAARINFNLQFLQKNKDGLYVMEFQGNNICVNRKRNRNFSFTLYFKEFCQCHEKLVESCQCFDDRKRQLKQWNNMIEIVKRIKKISQQELDKLVYGPNENKNNQSQLYEAEQKQMPVQSQEPIKQILE